MASANQIPDPDPQHGGATAMEAPESEGQLSPGKPFVVVERAGGGSGKDQTKKILICIVGAFVLFVALFGLISTKGKSKSKSQSELGKPSLGRVVTPSAPGQIIPAENTAAPVAAQVKTGALDAHDIEKTRVAALSNPHPNPVQAPAMATSQTSAKGAPVKALGQISKFQPPDTDPQHLQNWGPEPYRGQSHSDAPLTQSGQALRQEQDEYGKASMVFVAHQTNTQDKASNLLHPAVDNFGLASGYHVGVRLESMASTALNAPVTAVVEYNYQRDGRVLIPAGARAIGKISQADASGIMNITFTSLEMPTGEAVPISAIGATTSLQAIKGQVTGKNVGRSLAVRSLAGLGEAGAMLVGQGGVNSAVSESDLIRQRAAENIGSGADQQVMSLITTQHIVVSVPAGTEIYLIFTKPQRVSPTASQAVDPSTTAN